MYSTLWFWRIGRKYLLISKPHRPKESYNTFSHPSKEQLDVLKQNYELTSGYDQTDEQPIGRHAAKPNNKAPQ